MVNNLILEYLRATTNLYGIVPLEKVVEIYNQQNEDSIILADLEQYKEIQDEFLSTSKEVLCTKRSLLMTLLRLYRQNRTVKHTTFHQG